MEITNWEYRQLINGLEMSSKFYYISGSIEYSNNINTLKKKLVDEYSRIAEGNMEEGIEPSGESIYPSRLKHEYGGSIGDK
jgi:hypothetical protein